jgi:hypothetical protein
VGSETSIAVQRLGKQVLAAMNMKAILDVLLETMFSIRSFNVVIKEEG